MEGLRRFSEGGASALKVEAIAKSIGCSKSSFYWHFQNRSAFLSRMLSHWAKLGTADVIARLAEEQSVGERFHALLHEAFGARQGGDFLHHLRRLARSDAQAAALLETTERTRIHYIASLIEEAGMSAAEAAIRGELIYTHYLGWYERHHHEPVDTAALAALFDDLIDCLSLPDALRRKP